MRKELNTKEAMEIANISCKGDEITEVKMSEMLTRMISDCQDNKGIRLNHMNARIYNNRTLKSYNTLVAYYDGINVIELGKYSSSTSRQVTTFADIYGVNVIRLTDSSKYIKDNSDKFIW